MIPRRRPVALRILGVLGAFLALALLVGGAAAQERLAASEPLNLRLEPVPFENWPPPQSAPPSPLKLLAAYALHSDHAGFGGVSSLAFGPRGGLYAVSDVGRWLRFDLTQDEAGRLTGLRGVIGDLADGLGAFPKEDSDAEALAFSRNGVRVWVAFERRHRLWRYDLTRARGWPSQASAALAPRPLQALSRNRGIESLGILPDGALLALAENSRPGDSAIPGWILRPEAKGEKAEEAFFWRPRDGFLPTDLEVGPDGFVYVLERGFTLWRGWAARIRRFPLEALKPGARIDGEIFAEFDNRRHTLDNMEGIAIRREAGRLRLYLISDDNFFKLQRTLLLQFEFGEDEAP